MQPERKMSRNKKLQELLDRLAGTRGKPNPKEEAEAAPGDETAKSGRKAEDGCEGEEICTAPTDAGGENNSDNSDSGDNNNSIVIYVDIEERWTAVRNKDNSIDVTYVTTIKKITTGVCFRC